jgi:hypothetical protein
MPRSRTSASSWAGGNMNQGINGFMNHLHECTHCQGMRYAWARSWKDPREWQCRQCRQWSTEYIDPQGENH